MIAQFLITFKGTILMGAGIAAALTALFLFARIAYGLFIYWLARRRLNLTQRNMKAGMNEREAKSHIQNIAREHSTVRRSRQSAMRGLNLMTYFQLQVIRQKLSRTPAEIITMIPASLWLFDNFYLLYRELKKFQGTGGIHRFKNLPGLAGGAGRGLPRVTVLAREIITCCNNHVTESQLYSLLDQYQKDQPLTTAELWALQNALSLCLIEAIILRSQAILATIDKKRHVDQQLKRIIPDLVRKKRDPSFYLDRVFLPEQVNEPVVLAHIIHRLRHTVVDESKLAEWVLSRRSGEGNHNTGVHTDLLSEVLNQERQFEAEAEKDISTLIVSLKAVSELNWEDAFSRVSVLDAVLSKDPTQTFANMTAQSKSDYRKVIEQLARKFRLSETAVARKVIQLARTAFHQDKQSKAATVGYYVIGAGIDQLLESLSGSKSHRTRINRWLKAIRGICYFIGIFAVTAGLLGASWFLFLKPAESALWAKLLFLLILVIPSSALSLFLMNLLFTNLVKPSVLPAMDFSTGIPDTYCSFVVMPVIIDNPGQIEQYANQLEKHYLANRQKNLFFALLADYHDADEQVLPSDKNIRLAGIEAIQKLNDRYPSPYPRFFLFFRPRRWNPSQKCWMGWERKRGKLECFNAKLCGEPIDDFELVVGNEEIFPRIHYVITLDADTELLRDGAAQLIGVMAHPLNHPIVDFEKNRIIEGYAIVQSEIRTRITAQSISLFSRFFSGQAGIDPYATVVSDVYQDLFDEGIFAGKGIYDVRVFHRFLRNVIPENSVLSHDLLEGSLSRCAFASGIKLMDRCPAGVLSYIRREHRWIRGDWQLLPWIFSSSRINGLSRWKMIDNLRRSLVKPALLLLMLANAWLLPGTWWIWLFFAAIEPVLRTVLFLLMLAWRKLRNPTARIALVKALEQVTDLVTQTFLGIALLPFRAIIAIDAIVRTLYRLLISHRNLLEWQTAESVERHLQNTPSGYWRKMWPSVLPSLYIFWVISHLPIGVAFFFWCFAALVWLNTPWIAWAISRPVRLRARVIGDAEQIHHLRLTARKTWHYFEDHMTIARNWLCPDHIQVHPGPKVSNKTSPTNIGLQLLSLLSALDMGYLGLSSFIEQCEKIIDTLFSLPKWHGHLYNWYNIYTLQVLQPRYVSTVDSGNFFSHLIALKQGLSDCQKRPVIPEIRLEGLSDTACLAGFPGQSIEIPDSFERLTDQLEQYLSLDAPNPDDSAWYDRLHADCQSIQSDIRRFSLTGSFPGQPSLQAMAKSGQPEAIALIRRLNHLVLDIEALEDAVDFSVLYDNQVQLFRIGYNVATQTPDNGHYDLLASEARLASFLAIARGETPQKHWFTLGRPLTLVRGIPACVSWSGSMFEYLMPNLVMHTPAGSVLDESCLAAVIQQMKHARKNKIPWGISESQYYRFDTQSNYQYGPFGVQRLRLQASLKPAKVVAPYATLLALSVLPAKALDNLDVLRTMRAEGQYGFFEALDFNQPDATRFQSFSSVQSFMTHHQGMSLVAVNNFLHHDIMRNRFHTEPSIQASETLLEERRSGSMVTLASRGYAINVNVTDLFDEIIETRTFTQYDLADPIVHILSNTRYLLMVTSDGAGFSRIDNRFISRWSPDTIGDQSGQFIYVQNLSNNQLWSAAYLPTRAKPDEYQVTFSHEKADFIRRDGLIQTQTTLTVSPLNHLEVRRLTLTNQGNKPVDLALTSYLEVAADTYLADALHPAFSKLFLETEFVPDRHLLIAKRRRRDPDDEPIYIMHALVPECTLSRSVEYETDRRNFIGRGRSLADPSVIKEGVPLSNQDGFSKDTILSLRVIISVMPGASVHLNFITGYAPSREKVMEASYEFSKPFSASDVFKLALTSSRLQLKHLNITTRQLNTLLNRLHELFYPGRNDTRSQTGVRRLKLDQSGLWRFGISGDDPIILLTVQDMKALPVVQDVLLAFEYLRLNQVRADLVILNEEAPGYAQSLEQRLMELTGNLKIHLQDPNKTGLFVLRRSLIRPEEIDLLYAASSMTLDGQTGLYGLDNQKTARTQPSEDQAVIPLPAGRDLNPARDEDTSFMDNQSLEFFNGIGGFAEDGHVYEIQLSNNQMTPMPWINIIANKGFGFHVSETGAGYTWSQNSQSFKLTPWSNDPVLDPISEALYIRDNYSGGITSPTSLRACTDGIYRIRHGLGYSVFDHYELSLSQSLTLFVPKEDPVKLWLLKITNTSRHKRSLSIILYVTWVLGDLRTKTVPFIQTSFHEEAKLLTAFNRYDNEHRAQPSFIFSSEPIESYSGDRREFFSLGGCQRYPAGLAKGSFSNKTGVGMDPCGVIKIDLELDPKGAKTLVFGLGQAKTLDDAIFLASHYRDEASVQEAYKHVRSVWEKRCSKLMVHTPDRGLDLLVNGWLLYQVLSCRILARAAFYQCGGAIGFRDQLQDVMAWLMIDPDLARRQILSCCAHQFIEGDVLHWWHEDQGTGVRTRISDDLLWLPYVLAAYVDQTGQTDLLDIQVPFIESELLSDNESERLVHPRVSEQSDSVYHHALRAIDRACRTGRHGLPLMGSGDWNDGMNRVGINGEGESVWLGWFLYAVIQRFLPLIRHQRDANAEQDLASRANNLLDHIEEQAWDGAWYMRAFFDDGTPLGSKTCDECRIDSISQSWSILSGGASQIRGLTAIDSAKRYLVHPDNGLSLLLTPPFDRTSHDPGYIKGYYPGIRENGGQYTHAAIWLAMAFARSGDGFTASQLFTMLNPIHTTANLKLASHFENEPYVMSADISSGERHDGKGGWSWYTGSAGWMYQGLVGDFIGIRKQGDSLILNPHVPESFSRFVVEYTHGSTLYEMTFLNSHEYRNTSVSLLCDGETCDGNRLDLIDDGAVHTVVFHFYSR